MENEDFLVILESLRFCDCVVCAPRIRSVEPASLDIHAGYLKEIEACRMVRVMPAHD